MELVGKDWVIQSYDEVTTYLKSDSSSDSPFIFAVDFETSNISVKQLGTHQTNSKLCNVD